MDPRLRGDDDADASSVMLARVLDPRYGFHRHCAFAAAPAAARHRGLHRARRDAQLGRGATVAQRRSESGACSSTARQACFAGRGAALRSANDGAVTDSLRMSGGGAPFELRGRIANNTTDTTLRSVTIRVTRRDCYEGALDPSGCVEAVAGRALDRDYCAGRAVARFRRSHLDARQCAACARHGAGHVRVDRSGGRGRGRA